MVLITIFWVSGGYFASLLHLASHAFLKPALFLSSDLLEQNRKYSFKGVLRGYKNFLVPLLVSLLILGIISIPPSPMFFSEIFGFKAMLNVAKDSEYFFVMIGAIFFILLLLGLIFYKFITIYQEALYEGEIREKKVYKSEILMLLLFCAALASLLIPFVFEYIRSIS